MKVVHVNTSDIRGGAARAAYRLHLGLYESGIASSMLVRQKSSNDPCVHSVEPVLHNEDHTAEVFLSTVVQSEYINAHRTSLSNTLFTFPYPGCDISRHPAILDADIINLHWVAFYQSTITLTNLFSLGIPVVWTLHDMWPFTGGCHYAAGCEGYVTDCSSCPQLVVDPAGLPAAVLADKIKLFSHYPLTIVTPSKWLAECARKSKLFNRLRVEVIPNAVETSIFYPESKEEAKRSLGIDPQAVTLLFAAESGEEKRKGFEELLTALHHCIANPEVLRLLHTGCLRIICFGNPSPELHALGIPLVQLGYLTSDDAIRNAYVAADIVVLPSLEDNLPNVILEAMCCGTPVVAFATGGVPDVIVSEVNGLLVPPSDTTALAEAIARLILDRSLREAMGGNAASEGARLFSLKVQASRYTDLYTSLLEEKSERRECTLSGSAEVEDVAGSVPFNAQLGGRTGAAVAAIAGMKLNGLSSQMHVPVDERCLLLKNELESAKLKLAAIEMSRSWRLTKPLRRVLDAIRIHKP